MHLVEETNIDFEVVLIDPPWRIRGAERRNSGTMFSNNKFKLNY